MKPTRKASGYKPAPKAYTSALQRWSQLNAKRAGMLRRFEGYASVTIPKVCLPDNVDENSASIQHDWSSVGAQAVNHLTNKIIMALYPMGVPFFRLDANDKLAAQLAEQGISDDLLRDSLVGGEMRAMKIMDQRAVRPILFTCIRSLIVVGNILLDLSDNENPRAIGIRNYVVKRSMTGKMVELLHYEKVLWDELDDKAQAKVAPKVGEDAYVEYVRHFCLSGGKWTMRISADAIDLGEEFQKVWQADRFPFYALTWDLADNHNYGTGLVEDYAGDFGMLSSLSESEMKAAILASDFRWLANPAGTTDVEEFKKSRTGDVIPGVLNDLSLVAHVGAGNLQAIGMSAERVINRIGRGFLLGTAVTRNAERVTAEEIRMTAVELETSLGGVYSRLAVDMQLPITVWLLEQTDVSIKGTDLIPTVVTGLAALSRSGEAQQLSSFLAALGGIGNLNPDVLARLKLSAVITTLAGAYGISSTQYVKDEQQIAQEQEAAAQAAQQQEATSIAMQAGADKLTQKE